MLSTREYQTSIALDLRMDASQVEKEASKDEKMVKLNLSGFHD
jgi:hypothetical protein